MKTIQLFLFFLFLSTLPSDLHAQESDKAYVIQLATFGSWEDFAKNEKIFYTNTGTADNNIFAEKVGSRVKVYLFDSYQGGTDYFYAGSRLDKVLKEVRNNPHFKDAFRRSDVDYNKLVYYGDVFEKYKNNIPSEFNTKGGSTELAADNPTYKIQLGVFKEWKSLDYIVNRYNINEVDTNSTTTSLSHDFTKVKNTVCRRYYYGKFINKKAAMEKLKALQKASNRKLMLVKV